MQRLQTGPKLDLPPATAHGDGISLRGGEREACNLPTTTMSTKPTAMIEALDEFAHARMMTSNNVTQRPSHTGGRASTAGVRVASTASNSNSSGLASTPFRRGGMIKASAFTPGLLLSTTAMLERRLSEGDTHRLKTPPDRVLSAKPEHRETPSATHHGRSDNQAYVTVSPSCSAPAELVEVTWKVPLGDDSKFTRIRIQLYVGHFEQRTSVGNDQSKLLATYDPQGDIAAQTKARSRPPPMDRFRFVTPEKPRGYTLCLVTDGGIMLAEAHFRVGIPLSRFDTE